MLGRRSFSARGVRHCDAILGRAPPLCEGRSGHLLGRRKRASISALAPRLLPKKRAMPSYAAAQMLRDGIGPIVDKQSFASIQTPWTPYSWLGALAMKSVWDVGGYRGAIAMHAFMSASLLALIALACRALATT